MAQKTKDPVRALVERFIADLKRTLTDVVEREVRAVVARISSGKDKVDGRRSGRLCPVPGCGRPGAGPRNRWFCRDHIGKLSVTEQKAILERNRRLAAEGKLPTLVPAQRIVRLPPKQPRQRRPLDMTCRVEGCPNRSRGPRVGFICDLHRAQLSPDEQREARERWNQRHKGGGAQPEPRPQEAKAPAPVPPIIRKASSEPPSNPERGASGA
jgi:hypothetical protein